MMKKLMAALVSVVLAVGLSIPAFADDFADSAESGDPSEITQLVFSKTSYTVTQDEPLDLTKELTAYCGSKKICQYPNYEFSTDDTNLVFTVSQDGTVEAFEDSGSATVTVRETTSGKKATCRIVASKGNSGATGFKLESSTYTIYTGADIGDQGKLVVAPTGGSYFTSEQKDAIEAGIVNILDFTLFKMSDGTGADEGKLVFTPDSVGTVSGTKTYTIKVQFPRATDSTKVSNKTALLRVTTKSGVPAQNMARKSSVKIQIGETADLYDYLKFNSSANVGKECTFYLDFYDDKATSSDYAVLNGDGHTIKGVAVGRLKAVATLVSDSNVTATIPIEVTAKSGSSSSSEVTGDMSITPTTGTIRIGGVVLLTAKNVPSDSSVDWMVDDDSIASLTISNGKATVKGVKEGIVNVTAEVDGVEIGKAKIKVSNSAASSETSSESSSSSSGGILPTPPIVVNPSTGDSWFSFLF